MTSFRAPALISRERSILEFNRRVLAQARRKDVPLLERLRYICIVSSNMDEFFEVRFVDALEAARLTDELDDDEDLARAVVEAHAELTEVFGPRAPMYSANCEWPIDRTSNRNLRSNM